MNYQELKAIALSAMPHADACFDCGDVLHFISEHSDLKGDDITIVKSTGALTTFVMAIEDGLVNMKGMKLDFMTGDPV